MSLSSRLKRGYVAGLRGVRAVAEGLGLVAWLDGRRDRPAMLYLRSLLSIHDAADLISLDLPWWTFGAITHLDAWLQRRGGDTRAFEYGSGASTVWLARRCRQVVSVDHDAAWAEVTRSLCPFDHVTVVTVPPEPVTPATRCRSRKDGWTDLGFDRYVGEIARHPGPFDLIVIDGRCRAECLALATACLAPGGIIVFDNSRRRRYRSALAAAGMRRTVFFGLAPGLPYPDETSVFTREDT